VFSDPRHPPLHFLPPAFYPGHVLVVPCVLFFTDRQRRSLRQAVLCPSSFRHFRSFIVLVPSFHFFFFFTKKVQDVLLLLFFPNWVPVFFFFHLASSFPPCFRRRAIQFMGLTCPTLELIRFPIFFEVFPVRVPPTHFACSDCPVFFDAA